MVGDSKGHFNGYRVVKSGPHEGKSAAMILAEMERLSSERLAVEAPLYSDLKSGQNWGDNLPPLVADALEKRDAFLYEQLQSLARAYERLTGKVSPWGSGSRGGGGGVDTGSFWLGDDGKDYGGDDGKSHGGKGMFDFEEEGYDEKRRGKLGSLKEILEDMHRAGRGSLFGLESTTCKKCGCDFLGTSIAVRQRDGTTKKSHQEFCGPCDRLRRDEEKRCKKCGGLDAYIAVAPIPAGDGSKGTVYRQMVICPHCEPDGKSKEMRAIWAAKNRSDFLESLPPYVRSNKRDLFPDIGGSDAAIGHDFFFLVRAC